MAKKKQPSASRFDAYSWKNVQEVQPGDILVIAQQDVTLLQSSVCERNTLLLSFGNVETNKPQGQQRYSLTDSVYARKKGSSL